MEVRYSSTKREFVKSDNSLWHMALNIVSITIIKICCILNTTRNGDRDLVMMMMAMNMVIGDGDNADADDDDVNNFDDGNNKCP